MFDPQFEEFKKWVDEQSRDIPGSMEDARERAAEGISVHAAELDNIMDAIDAMRSQNKFNEVETTSVLMAILEFSDTNPQVTRSLLAVAIMRLLAARKAADPLDNS